MIELNVCKHILIFSSYIYEFLEQLQVLGLVILLYGVQYLTYSVFQHFRYNKQVIIRCERYLEVLTEPIALQEVKVKTRVDVEVEEHEQDLQREDGVLVVQRLMGIAVHEAVVCLHEVLIGEWVAS